MADPSLPLRADLQSGGGNLSGDAKRKRAEMDQELMRQLASGDEEAFALIYQRLAPVLFSVVHEILRDQKESEDVLQEVFVQMWKKSSSYDSSRSSLFTWAVMISRNRAIDRLRSRHRRSRVVEAATVEAEISPPESAAGADNIAEQSDERERLRTALHQLGSPQREALVLAFFGGLTQTEISAKLDAPLGTVKARIRRGLLALRDIMGGDV